jgi:hypothetical protein
MPRLLFAWSPDGQRLLNPSTEDKLAIASVLESQGYFLELNRWNTALN